MPLFALDTQGDVITLKTSSAFYALTGRQATAAGPQAMDGLAAAPSAEALVEQAEALAEHGGRAERLSAIAIIGHLGPAKTSKSLKNFLIRVVTRSPTPDSAWPPSAGSRPRSRSRTRRCSGACSPSRTNE